LLSGCGLLFGSGREEATPVAQAFTPVPTFTATPQTAAQPAEPAATLASPADTPAPVALPITLTATLTATQVAAQAEAPTTAPQPPAPELVVTGDAVNVRSGPDTTYEIAGAAARDQVFAVTGRNAAGDWWQICCIDGQPGWIFGELAQVQQGEAVAVVADLPAPPATTVAVASTASAAQPTTAVPPAAEPDAAAPTAAPVAAVPPFGEGSAGNFDLNAQYQIVHFKVLGLDENNGGIRDSSAQHHIFLTVLDAGGNGVDGAVVRNAVGEKQDVTTGGKGPGKAEITMYWEPFKLYVASDPSGPVTSQVSNQMGLAFPHLPDLVGKLGGLDYEYGVCPTLEIKCEWPIQAVHFSYEITFQKVK
jgi:SH3-like domain-containing protein